MPTVSEAFSAVVEALQATHTRYALIGALAATAWSRARYTADVDVVAAIEPAHWPTVRDALVQRGFVEGAGIGPAEPADLLPDIAVFWSSPPPGVRLDLFFAKLDFEHAVLERARTAVVLGREVNVASPEAVLVYKLLANRPKDTLDVEAVFEARRLSGQPVDWAFLEHWTEAWGIRDRLEAYRERFGAPRSG